MATTPAQAAAKPRLRTNVYIDGFNFYYGAVKNTRHKWLNFDGYLRSFRPNDDIQRIYYFTARVDAGDQRNRQDVYLLALATLPNLTIIEGKFMHKSVQCRVTACTSACDRIFKTAEEKRTDVNIAVRMLDDAYQNVCEQFVLISGDSDLVPAIQTIKRRFPEKQIHVYVPSRGRSGQAVELRAVADRAREVPLTLLAGSQFPSSVPDGSGGHYNRPATW